MSRRRHAFTLVELLVVIGIIALLISILLPALNKARQQANVIDCQARLRTMGQVLAIYVADNKGMVPWGAIARQATIKSTWQASPADSEPFWWWCFTLGQYMNRGMVGSDGFVRNLSKVFEDKDTIDFGTNVTVPKYVNHYTVNERIMWSNTDKDSLPEVVLKFPDGNYVPQRKMGSIKPSTVFVIWDAPQIEDQGGNAYPLATELDGNELTFGHYFCTNPINPLINYGRPVSPGIVSQSQSASVCKTAQKKFNRDLHNAFKGLDAWNSQIRFRHMNNTELNALCLDGHVERRSVGTAMVLDFCTNNPY